MIRDLLNQERFKKIGNGAHGQRHPELAEGSQREAKNCKKAFTAMFREKIVTTTNENIRIEAVFRFDYNKSAFALPVSLNLPYFKSNKIDSNTIKIK